jgi:hypothetical protein
MQTAIGWAACQRVLANDKHRLMPFWYSDTDAFGHTLFLLLSSEPAVLGLDHRLSLVSRGLKEVLWILLAGRDWPISRDIYYMQLRTASSPLPQRAHVADIGYHPTTALNP